MVRVGYVLIEYYTQDDLLIKRDIIHCYKYSPETCYFEIPPGVYRIKTKWRSEIIFDNSSSDSGA